MSERQANALLVEGRHCHGREAIDGDAVLCDYTLRKVCHGALVIKPTCGYPVST